MIFCNKLYVSWETKERASGKKEQVERESEWKERASGKREQVERESQWKERANGKRE